MTLLKESFQLGLKILRVDQEIVNIVVLEFQLLGHTVVYSESKFTDKLESIYWVLVRSHSCDDDKYDWVSSPTGRSG